MTNLALTDSEQRSLQRLAELPHLMFVKEWSARHAVPVFLGGGSLRDLIIRDSLQGDLDLYLQGDLEQWTALRAALSDAEAASPQQFANFKVDVTRCKDVHTFVIQFDYTINTIVLDLNSWTLSCPTTGIEDARARLLRTTSPLFIAGAPKSAIRGFRLAAQLELTIEHETEDAIIGLSPLLAVSNPVLKAKILAELLRLFGLPGYSHISAPFEKSQMVAGAVPQLLLREKQMGPARASMFRELLLVDRAVASLRPEQQGNVYRAVHEYHYVGLDRLHLHWNAVALARLAIVLKGLEAEYFGLDRGKNPLIARKDFQANGSAKLLESVVELYQSNPKLVQLVRVAWQLTRDPGLTFTPGSAVELAHQLVQSAVSP